MDLNVAFFISACTYATYEFSKFFMILALYGINKVASFRSMRDTKQRDYLFYGVSMLTGCVLYPLMTYTYEYFANLNYFVALLPGLVMFVGMLKAVMKSEGALLRKNATMVYFDHGNGKLEKSVVS